MKFWSAWYLENYENVDISNLEQNKNVDISNLEQDENVDIFIEKIRISRNGKCQTPGRYRVLRPVFLLFWTFSISNDLKSLKWPLEVKSNSGPFEPSNNFFKIFKAIFKTKTDSFKDN